MYFNPWPNGQKVKLTEDNIIFLMTQQIQKKDTDFQNLKTTTKHPSHQKENSIPQNPQKQSA